MIDVVFLFYVLRDSKPERVSSVLKTVRWTVFSYEVRSGCATRMKDASEACSFIPSPRPRQKTIFILMIDVVFLFYELRDSKPEMMATPLNY